MLNKHKKSISFSLSLLLILTMAFPTYAKTTNSVDSNQPISYSDSVLYSADGSEVSDVSRQTLAEYGVILNKNSLIEVRPLISDNSKSVLVISNVIGDLITRDILVSLEEDGSIQSPILKTQGNDSTRGGTTLEYPFNKTYSIRATAVYNQRTDSSGLSSYYQPLGVYFVYYNTGSSTVSYVKVEYFCTGFEYTYPGFQPINNNKEYEHRISVSKNSPAKNTMYDAMNEYRSDRVIRTGSGSPMVGQHITFTYTVNGTTYTHTLRAS